MVRVKDASDTDRAAAARVAEKVFVNVPYGWSAANKLNPVAIRAGLDKTRKDRMTCSSLVWNAWMGGANVDLDSDYVNTFGTLGSLLMMKRPYYVMPDDILMSDKVKFITDIPLPSGSVGSGKPAPQAPAVAVTMESGTSYCLVKKVFSQGGRNYIVLDYITLKDIGDDYAVVNENPKLRTFELPADAKLAAWWLVAEQRGTGVMENLDWEAAHAAGGIPISLEDLQRAIDDETVNKFHDDSMDRWWQVKVRDGRVISLAEEYQD